MKFLDFSFVKPIVYLFVFGFPFGVDDVQGFRGAWVKLARRECISLIRGGHVTLISCRKVGDICLRKMVKC